MKRFGEVASRAKGPWARRREHVDRGCNESWKVTMVDTGLPGRPNTKVSRQRPKEAGCQKDGDAAK